MTKVKDIPKGREKCETESQVCTGTRSQWNSAGIPC